MKNEESAFQRNIYRDYIHNLLLACPCESRGHSFFVLNHGFRGFTQIQNFINRGS